MNGSHCSHGLGATDGTLTANAVGGRGGHHLSTAQLQSMGRHILIDTVVMNLCAPSQLE
jgi:hypothetical protein